jgi:hypothetical protein
MLPFSLDCPLLIAPSAFSSGFRDNHTCLGSGILPCPYVEIRDNHMGLGSVILPCTFAGIKDDHMCLGSAILHCQYALCVCFVRLRLMYPMLPFSLDCPLLIAPSAFSSGFFHNKYRFLNKKTCIIDVLGVIFS